MIFIILEMLELCSSVVIACLYQDLNDWNFHLSLFQEKVTKLCPGLVLSAAVGRC